MIFDTQSSEIISHLEDRELQNLFTPTRLIVKVDLPKIDIGSVHLKPLHENDLLEVPRWVAETLAELKLAVIQEETFDTELFKALSRERIQATHQLATLHSEFYLSARRHQARTKDEKDEYDERNFRSLYDLVTLRTGKLLSLSSSPTLTSQLKEKLTPEEIKLYQLVNRIVTDWRKAILQGDE